MQSGHSIPGEQVHGELSVGDARVDKLLHFEKILNMWREKLEALPPNRFQLS
jgi:hypothetical protein